MSPVIPFSCPVCQGGIEASVDQRGKPATCPHCGELVKVPNPYKINRTAAGTSGDSPAADWAFPEGGDGRPIICPSPNCGYRGPGKTIGGFGWLLFFLLFLGILPGILYAILSARAVCPKCGLKLR